MYDGANSMIGKKSGVATKLLVEQPQALVTHCQGHSLSLAVKDLTVCCKILCDTMSTVREICVLIKYSPKRKYILGRMQKMLKETLTLILINFRRLISCAQLVGGLELLDVKHK